MQSSATSLIRTMPGSEKKELSLAIIRYLKSIGIHIQHWKSSSVQEKVVPSSSGALFGVPLRLLPLSKHAEGVPQFLVDACELLRPHLHIEGLFRKCGSVTRIKALKSRLEAGENCLEMALPCDVAALIKQFLRAIPDPLIPEVLRRPLCQAQQRGDDLRDPLTILLTCLFPPKSADILRYFFHFLQDVAARCIQNKMDLANLAVVFAPNLFPSELCSKLDRRAEEQLRRQAAVVQALISHASEIGTIPQLLLEKVQVAFSDLESKQSSSGPEDARSEDIEGKRKRRQRRGESLSDATLKTSFNSKRKASDDALWTAELTARKRRSVLDSASSDLSENAEDPFDQPTGEGILQAPQSVALVFSSSSVNPASDAGSQATSPRVPVQRKRSSCRKRPQRKHSVRTTPCCSPVPFERKDAGRKSLRIFSRSSKAPANPLEQPAPISPKAVEPGSWLMVKRMVTEALEGPTSQQRRTQLPSHKPKGNKPGFPSQSADEDPRTSLCTDLEAPVALVKCCHAAGLCSCLDGLVSRPQKLDLDALFGSRGKGESLVGEARKPDPPPRPHRVLRRSLSWPEDLSVRDAAEQKEMDLSPGEALTSSGGHEAQILSLAEPTQPDVEVVVAGVRQLGIPAVCVTLADGYVAACPEDRPSNIPQGLLPCKPDLLEACTTLRHIEAPKTSLKRLTLTFQRSSSQANKETGVARLSPPKRKGGRRFGRSVSHESGLPLQAREEMLAGQPGHASKRGATMLPAKSPLQAFKAYGRQIFISHKHISLSLAGLRGKKESSSPSPPNTEELARDSQEPPMERLFASAQ